MINSKFGLVIICVGVGEIIERCLASKMYFILFLSCGMCI